MRENECFESIMSFSVEKLKKKVMTSTEFQRTISSILNKNLSLSHQIQITQLIVNSLSLIHTTLKNVSGNHQEYIKNQEYGKTTVNQVTWEVYFINNNVAQEKSMRKLFHFQNKKYTGELIVTGQNC